MSFSYLLCAAPSCPLAEVHKPSALALLTSCARFASAVVTAWVLLGEMDPSASTRPAGFPAGLAFVVITTAQRATRPSAFLPRHLTPRDRPVFLMHPAQGIAR